MSRSVRLNLLFPHKKIGGAGEIPLRRHRFWFQTV
jgi:hypothetical protein